MYKLFSLVLLSILISSCSLLDPWVYKINKQQGNITEQEHVDKLEVGMTKEQVKFVLGTPMSVGSFDTNVWHYIYTYKDGNDELTRHILTIKFSDSKMTEIIGEALIKLKDKSKDEPTTGSTKEASE